MSGESPRDREKRDAALARMLASALGPATDGTDAAGGGACPRAEVLAAYADHGLDSEQTQKWESHFAECGRCRKILAVLTVNTQEPLTDQEVERFGQLAATAELPSVPAQPAQAPRRRVWRWLAPALGAAAGVLLWFSLRPVVGRLMPSQQVAERPTVATPAPAAGDSETARASVPPAPAASGAAPQAQQSAPSGKASGAISPQKKEERVETARAETPAAPAAAGEALQAAPMRAARAHPPAEAANAPQQNAAAEAKTAEQAQRLPNAASRSRARSLEMSGVAGGSVFASPNRNVLWRIGPDGSIERSTDGGRSWQQQTSGVTADLRAGAAPADDIAWVAGRDIILRTTDGGEHWQRVAPPGGAGAEWTDIAASDALHVTVSGTVAGADRRFHSDDGGKSWTPEP